MTVLNVTVENKIATADNQIIVCDNTDYIVQFTLDAEWDDYDAKTMRILYSTGTYEDIVFTGTSCPLPRIYNAAAIGIGIYAGDLHATVAAVFNCKRSVLSEDGTPVDPPEDVYNQIMDAINDGMLKGDPGNGIASIELTSTSGNVDTYTITYTDETTTTFTVTNGSVTSVDGLTGDVVLDHKANIDGYYDGMTVATADQLLSNKTITDNTPYVNRQSGGGNHVGDRKEIKEIVGSSIVWNQLCENGNFASSTKWNTTTGTTLSVTDNVATFTATAYGGRIDHKSIAYKGGHTYLIESSVKISSGQARMSINGGSGASVATQTTGTFERLSKIYTFSEDTDTSYPRFYDLRESGWDGVQVKDVVIFDLTAMFGSAIADRAYALEQTTAGSGVAWLKSYGFFTKPYYAYTSSLSLQSVNVSAHETIGYNQWDEVWEAGGISDVTGENSTDSSRIRSKNYIRVSPNTVYYFTSPSQIMAYWYDGNKNYIGKENVLNSTKTSPSNAAYLRFKISTTTYNNDICINIHGDRDGEYEPYHKNTYPFDGTKTLNGILKLDENYNIYADGDVYHNHGTIDRNYENRAYQSGDEELANAITDGTYTVVKLANPTTETADAYQQVMAEDPNGTERWIDAEYVAGNRDFEMPVGHSTEYHADLKAKLEDLPDSPNSDGDYLLRRRNGVNSYVRFVSELPAEPTEDGVYTLTATVSGGVATYSWEA
jgi:hypothetical protein